MDCCVFHLFRVSRVFSSHFPFPTSQSTDSCYCRFELYTMKTCIVAILAMGMLALCCALTAQEIGEEFSETWWCVFAVNCGADCLGDCVAWDMGLGLKCTCGMGCNVVLCLWAGCDNCVEGKCTLLKEKSIVRCTSCEEGYTLTRLEDRLSKACIAGRVAGNVKGYLLQV